MEYLKNNKLIKYLEEIIKKDRISHSYLFYGDEYGLQKEIATLFAKAILCENKDFFCCSCSSCEKFLWGNHPDFFEVGKQNVKGQSFNVFDVREIIEKSFVKPNESKFKIFLLNDVQTLFGGAINSLLKILEEPPKGVVFVLTAINKNKVLKTVFSRCVSFFVSVPCSKDYLEFFGEQDKNIKKETLKEVFVLSQGKVGLFKMLLLTPEGEKALFLSKNLFEVFLKEDELEFNAILQKLERDLNLIFLVLSCFLKRMNIFINNLKKENFKQTENFYRIFNLVEEALDNLKSNANVGLCISCLSCKVFDKERDT